MRLRVAFGAVALILILAGCALLIDRRGDLRASLATWNDLKTANGEHYRYEVSTELVFGPSTTLTVREGEVVQRDLAITEINDQGKIVVTKRWSETGAALGTHVEGAELITVDERYSRCRDVLGRNAPTEDITLEVPELTASWRRVTPSPKMPLTTVVQRLLPASNFSLPKTTDNPQG